MNILRNFIYIAGLTLFALLPIKLHAQNSSIIVNDVTQLNPIKVRSVLIPATTQDIINAIKSTNGPISIGGGRFSQGGQTATEQALQIDMRGFDKVISFSKHDKEITVQTGITWRKLQQYIDTTGLSVKIMQSYANFTVGGALSVNAHGRYAGLGPIVLSVKQIKIILSNGQLITASPNNHANIFYGAIGGYGGLGVITEATLDLSDNCKVERTDTVMNACEYKGYYFRHVRNNPSVVFHSADIYPNQYNEIRAISHLRTEKPVTVIDRLKPFDQKHSFNQLMYTIVSDHPAGKWIRRHIVDPLIYSSKAIEWKNYEAASDVAELEPRSRKTATYVLEEYFVPVDQFNSFYPLMGEILKRNNVNVINISIRESQADPGTLMAWARTEVFSFVIYYKQGTTADDKAKVEKWTRELIDAVIKNNGTYYLPYQIHATPQQFAKAYPNAPRFFELKKQLDPTNKFRNKLWDAYYKP